MQNLTMAETRALTPGEFEQEAGDRFREVFASTDPLGSPFTEAMTERAILFSGAFRLDAGEALALADTAREVGDRGFYVTMTERPASGPFVRSDPDGDGPDQGVPQDWFVPFSDLATYVARESASRLPIDVENALLSPSAKWGAIFSHEHLVVIGGVTPFVGRLLDAWPDAWIAPTGGKTHSYTSRESVLAWLRYLKWDRDQLGAGEPDWLAGLLGHVYGETEAWRLQQRAAAWKPDNGDR
jgi:hypothetical protein